MNKGFNVVFALVLVFGLVFASGLQNVEASKGFWNVGTDVNLDMAANPAPTYLQLMSVGTEITGPAQICHPFNEFMDNWVAEVRQLKDHAWVKLTTTVALESNEESNYMACAQAPAAGTYALFGYYNKPQEAGASEGLGASTGEWNTGEDISVIRGYPVAPYYMQLVGSGVEVTGPAKICHAFKDGKYSWAGEIRQLKAGSWVKLATTMALESNNESNYLACAQAPAAGIYALFGYYLGK